MNWLFSYLVNMLAGNDAVETEPPFPRTRRVYQATKEWFIGWVWVGALLIPFPDGDSHYQPPKQRRKLSKLLIWAALSAYSFISLLIGPFLPPTDKDGRL